MHQDILHNPKIVTLSDRQHRVWINCLLLADADDGVLPKIRDIACYLRMSIQDAELVLSELVEVDLIDVTVTIGAPRTLRMHDWKAHQYISDVSTDRVRKFRNKNSNGKDETFHETFQTVSETSPESYSYSESEKNPNGLLSSPTAAREGAKTKGIIFGFGTGRDDKTKDKLVSRAEGLGVPVDDMLAKVNAHNAKNRPAYFTKLCVDWLSEKLPNLDEQILRDALWDKKGQYAVVMQLLVLVP